MTERDPLSTPAVAGGLPFDATQIQFTQAGTGAVARTVQSKERDIISVKDFGALGDGVTDDTAAITAADAACCSGALGLDGSTVIAQKALYFPAGRYKHTGLTYRGAPWFGDGINATFLDYYGSTYAINAVGTTGARKLLNISAMNINGSTASAGARGLKLGYNQRSLGALTRVRIENFSADGLYFFDNSWQMSFYDVYIHACGSATGSGIGVDAAVTSLGDIDWYKLQLETCGKVGNATGGGFELNNANLGRWGFFALLLQGNLGAAEGRILAGSAYQIDGLWIESDLAAAGATDGLIIGGSINASLDSPLLTAAGGHGGTALRITNTAQITLANPWIHTANWPTQISVENTAKLILLSEGNLDRTKLTVASGATVYPYDSTYTPTNTAVTNLDSVTAYACMYYRTGNHVTVAGKFDADPTAAASTALGVSLPIASNLTVEQDLCGTAFGGNNNSEGARIFADTVNDRATIQWTSTTTVNAGWSFQFRYIVK